MNTLSRAITARIFQNEGHYYAVQAEWKKYIHSGGKLNSAHYLFYLALRGKDWRKAFTPLTSTRKLENGAFFTWGLFRAMSCFHSQRAEENLLKPFGGAVTTRMLHLLRELVGEISPYTTRPEDFTAGTFPFEAYPNAEKALEKSADEERINA